MHAAVVTEFGRAPRYLEVDDPQGASVEVVAAALHPRVRSQAGGSHYTSAEELPLTPGVDGVGRRPDGSLVYFVLDDVRFGSMADRVALDPRRCLPLPAGADPIAIAAAANPAMSSWIALRRRARIRPGQSVLVLGATGSAGQLAVQVAKQLGAGTVVAAGRDRVTLDSLGAADVRVSIAGDPAEAAARVGEAAADIDIVLDYVWGTATEAIMPALLRRRADESAPLTWVEIGSVAGTELALPSAWLRAADVALMGSGQGSVPTRGILEELVPLTAELSAGTFAVDADVRELADVEAVWSEPANPRRRIVFTP